MLIGADGAPGLIKAVEQCWPASDRQHCAVHRVRNLLATLPERERERVRQAYVFEAVVVLLGSRPRHRRRWRSTNLLERSLGEVKRRTKVIGRFPGETSCLTLVWAVLDLYISHATNGIRFNQLERQRLKRLRYEGHEQGDPEEVNAA